MEISGYRDEFIPVSRAIRNKNLMNCVQSACRKAPCKLCYLPIMESGAYGHHRGRLNTHRFTLRFELLSYQIPAI